MADVYLARLDGPCGFQKWVAIKKTHAYLVDNDSFVNMFLDEARVAARISHPNVATVFDVGRDGAAHWIAMEYLHGESLRDAMRRTEELGTALAPAVACHMIAEAAEGLHAAHELCDKDGANFRLVHRDVSPHNIFVTYDGVTKIMDFGVAKFTSRTSQTEDGSLKGKPAYMSPEQVAGGAVDRRTDIFALGVVLWELTTGRRLFHTTSEIDTLARVLECQVPSPSSIISNYPEDLERIVMKALSKDPAGRFPTARELSRAIRGLLLGARRCINREDVMACMHSLFRKRIEQRDAQLQNAGSVSQSVRVLTGLHGRSSSDVPDGANGGPGHSPKCPGADADSAFDDDVWDATTIANADPGCEPAPRSPLGPSRPPAPTTDWPRSNALGVGTTAIPTDSPQPMTAPASRIDERKRHALVVGALSAVLLVIGAVVLWAQAFQVYPAAPSTTLPTVAPRRFDLVRATIDPVVRGSAPATFRSAPLTAPRAPRKDPAATASRRGRPPAGGR